MDASIFINFSSSGLNIFRTGEINSSLEESLLSKRGEIGNHGLCPGISLPSTSQKKSKEHCDGTGLSQDIGCSVEKEGAGTPALRWPRLSHN